MKKELGGLLSKDWYECYLIERYIQTTGAPELSEIYFSLIERASKIFDEIKEYLTKDREILYSMSEIILGLSYFYSDNFYNHNIKEREETLVSYSRNRRFLLRKIVNAIERRENNTI